ncbi:hypothetical protein GCM10009069_08720 [Algimonas arctica]|uniref:Uncharacterized protein n=1 Tax=Algimonas arctica TaxID=1479486 RepID=A0A8J3CNL4_9PROT|nr:hypothetical protein [Algimonas arctica]GHA88026.1 hypothetical protein GCM10009069_08720 [Algimonas arctica]
MEELQALESNTLSLYFSLHEGRNADLEVISHAAIEWVRSLRHAAKMIEPTAEIKVKLIDADESSLKLNSLLHWGEKQTEVS